MKKKGKVHPSPPPPSQPPPPPPPSSSSSSSPHYLNEQDESLSVLRLLPATILVLVTVLSAEDRQVLAYLITRGTATTKTKTKKKKNKSSRNHHHKPPVFDCECFDCYTTYWLRWDSSPNRELIHEIIEAFENHHLASGGEDSVSRSKSKRGSKKKEKPVLPVVVVEVVEQQTAALESHVSSPDKRLSEEAEVAERETQDEVVEEEEATVGLPASGQHKGLARKVLPDVLGLFNSSFWRLWNPNA